VEPPTPPIWCTWIVETCNKIYVKVNWVGRAYQLHH